MRQPELQSHFDLASQRGHYPPHIRRAIRRIMQSNHSLHSKPAHGAMESLLLRAIAMAKAKSTDGIVAVLAAAPHFAKVTSKAEPEKIASRGRVGSSMAGQRRKRGGGVATRGGVSVSVDGGGTGDLRRQGSDRTWW